MGLLRTTNKFTIKVANGGASSAVVDGERFAIWGLFTPAVLTNATITFEASADGTTFVPVYDEDNAQVSITVVINAAKAYDLPTQLAPWRYWRLVMGGNEGAERTFVVWGKG